MFLIYVSVVSQVVRSSASPLRLPPPPPVKNFVDRMAEILVVSTFLNEQKNGACLHFNCLHLQFLSMSAFHVPVLFFVLVANLPTPISVYQFLFSFFSSVFG